MNRQDTPPSEETSEEQPSTFADFPEEARESVTGLAWLGFLEDTVYIWGHEFRIRTLRVGEELQVGLLTKKYADSIGEENAVATATVAMALKSIDGDTNFCPQAMKESAFAEQRYQWLQANCYMPTVIRIFEAYLGLIQEQRDILARVEDLSSGSRDLSMTSPDSFIEKEDYIPEVPLETMQGIADLADSNDDS